MAFHSTFNNAISQDNKIVVNRVPLSIVKFSKPVLIAHNTFTDNTGVRGIINLISSSTIYATIVVANN